MEGKQIQKADNKELPRNAYIDILRGILIITVVFGHYGKETLHDIIYLFHMPLFFIVSGYLLKRSSLQNREYIKKKFGRLMLPYVIYLLADVLLVRRTYNLKMLIYLVWGGRVLTGTYWYITCYLFSLVVFALLMRHFSDKRIKLIVLIGGGVAVIESWISTRFELLYKPGIPWNIDVALIALVYIAIGFYSKEKINNVALVARKRYDVLAIVIATMLTLFCVFNTRNKIYYFDMKYVCYKELFLAILIPCAFGYFLLRVAHWLNMASCLFVKFLILCGKSTVPIMFMHVPLNKAIGECGLIIYVLVGLGIPLAFTLAFGRFKAMRKFCGLPDLR